MRRLIALYPGPWRRRYGLEFAAMLDSQPASPGLIVDVLLGAIDAHLDPQVAEDGEDPLRRRMKEVVMNGLRSRSVMVSVGLLLPVAVLLAAYLNPVLRQADVGPGFAIASALATGLLVGRWWAPVSFVVAWAIGFAMVGGNVFAMWNGNPSTDIGWAATMAMGWSAVCLVGVAARALVARTGALRNRPA